MNLVTSIVEITLCLIAILGFLLMLKPYHPLYIKDYIVEDVYASMTSLNYVNYTPQDVCSVIKTVLPENYIYNVSINGTYICGYPLKEKMQELECILVKNGTIYNIVISIGK